MLDPVLLATLLYEALRMRDAASLLRISGSRA